MNNSESVGFVLFVNNHTGMMQGPQNFRILKIFVFAVFAVRAILQYGVRGLGGRIPRGSARENLTFPKPNVGSRMGLPGGWVSASGTLPPETRSLLWATDMRTTVCRIPLLQTRNLQDQPVSVVKGATGCNG